MNKITWKNETRKIEDLNPAAYNPRQMSEKQAACLQCGNMFSLRKRDKNREPKYCSQACYGKSIIGHKSTEAQKEALRVGRLLPHSNKGSRWSDESCKKLSKSKKGKKLTIEHRVALSRVKIGKPIKHFIKNKIAIIEKIRKSLTGKPQLNNRGAKHPNWQGGITPINKIIRSSIEMKNWRRAIFNRDNFTCQICGQRGGRLVADHIKPFSLYPGLRLDIYNGRTICRNCDLKSETYGGRAIKFNKEDLCLTKKN